LKRSLVVAVLLVAACKDKAPPAKRDAGPVVIDWFDCENALRKAPGVGESDRLDTLIAGCRVCGDWTPLLQWSKPQQEGGPTRLAIEHAMLACDGYCDGGAKQRFLGTLDNARGADVRTPWRWLGEMCKDKVSAVPDTRYMSAPYFVLDRIARAVAAHGGEPANLLAKVEIGLPAVTMTGIGPALPIDEANPKAMPMPRHHITIIGNDLYVGDLPRGHLDATGVHVDYGSEPYPGRLVKIEELAALWASEKTPPVAILASRATPAEKLAAVVAAAGDKALYLAIDIPRDAQEWAPPTVLPVRLGAKGPPEIAVTSELTVQQLVPLLKNAHADRVGITKRP
jgi:hypothetical protein